MKNYEKAYKEALERAKKILEFYKDPAYAEVYAYAKEDIPCIFPELSESDDENIKKSIIEHLKECCASTPSEVIISVYAKWIDWLEKQGESKGKPRPKQVWDYCKKISHEWWQMTMDEWNTLTDEDKNKYNSFIGFDYFRDTLMCITAGALFQLIDTGKLEYEEGSLLLEKPNDAPKHVEFMSVSEKSQREQEPDPRYNALDKLIEADDVYQMAMNNVMVEEAIGKAMEALSKLEISKLLFLEKQKLNEFQYWKPSEEQMEALDYAYNSCPDTERGNHYEDVLRTLIDDLYKLQSKQGEQNPIDKIEPKFKVGYRIK